MEKEMEYDKLFDADEKVQIRHKCFVRPIHESALEKHIRDYEELISMAINTPILR